MPWQTARNRLIAFLDRRAVRDGLIVGGIALIVATLCSTSAGDPITGYDARVYYDAAHSADPYGPLLAGAFDGYKYPPPLAQLLRPLALAPWPAFWSIWLGLLLLAYLFMAGRWALPLLVLWPPILGEFWMGNVNLFLAVAIVASFRWPAAWAAVLLTKGTPGIGLLWYAVRREWRPLAIAAAVTVAVAAVSFVVAPSLWPEFVEVARAQLAAEGSHPLEIPIGLPVRVLVAAILVIAGARTDRRWTVPIAAAIAMPFAWWGTLAVAVAAIPLASPASAPVAARLAGNRPHSITALHADRTPAPGCR